MRAPPLPWALAFEQMKAWRIPPLRFDDVDEAHFQRVCGPARLRHFVSSGVLALLVFNVFLLSDRVMIPDVYAMAVQLRLFVYTPIALVLLLLGWRFASLMLRWPPMLIEGAVTLSGVGAALSMGWLLVHSKSDLAGMYVTGLVPIIVYGNLVQRFRFRYALLFSLVVIGVSMGCAWHGSLNPHPYAALDIPQVLLVIMMSSYTLVMNYRFELEERRRYKRALRARALQLELSASQAQLQEMSRRDALTGVPNRRHVDEYVRTSWDAAQRHGGILALLLIDVDHFKDFNDRYGHPAGDQCLKHVAQVLAAQVPAESGCVARWGGEEFIVALPGASASQAMRVAQGLCDAVFKLSLRHAASSTAPCVTISVGVAVTQPGSGAGSVESLIDLADAALYKAKEGGRNRCMLALTQVSG